MTCSTGSRHRNLRSTRRLARKMSGVPHRHSTNSISSFSKLAASRRHGPLLSQCSFRRIPSQKLETLSAVTIKLVVQGEVHSAVALSCRRRLHNAGRDQQERPRAVKRPETAASCMFVMRSLLLMVPAVEILCATLSKIACNSPTFLPRAKHGFVLLALAFISELLFSVDLPEAKEIAEV